MAVTHSNTGTHSTGSATTSFSPSTPGGSGGKLWAGIRLEGGGLTITPPSGWVSVASRTFWFSSARVEIFRQTTGVDNPAFTSGSNGAWSGALTRLAGQHSTTPVDATATPSGEIISDPFDTDDLSVTNNGSLILKVAASYLASGTSIDAVTDYTLRASDVSGDDFGMWTGEFDSGTDGGRTIDFNGGLRFGWVMVAIAPDPGGGGSNIPAIRNHLRQLAG